MQFIHAGGSRSLYALPCAICCMRAAWLDVTYKPLPASCVVFAGGQPDLERTPSSRPARAKSMHAVGALERPSCSDRQLTCTTYQVNAQTLNSRKTTPEVCQTLEQVSMNSESALCNSSCSSKCQDSIYDLVERRLVHDSYMMGAGLHDKLGEPCYDICGTHGSAGLLARESPHSTGPWAWLLHDRVSCTISRAC